jgi:hypothetical protein
MQDERLDAESPAPMVATARKQLLEWRPADGSRLTPAPMGAYGDRHANPPAPMGANGDRHANPPAPMGTYGDRHAKPPAPMGAYDLEGCAMKLDGKSPAPMARMIDYRRNRLRIW